MTQLIVTAGTLVDGTGRSPLSDPVIFVRDGRIVDVREGRKEDLPAEAELLDLGDATLAPGLVDLHVHFLAPRTDSPYQHALEDGASRLIRAVGQSARLLYAGFTLARDVGGRNSIFLRDAVSAGEIAGPHLQAARLVLTQTGGHADMHFVPRDIVASSSVLCRLADGVDECRRAAREQLREGADLIKICTSGGVSSQRDRPENVQFTLEEARAICEEAHNFGARVAAHAQGTRGIALALEAGVDTIEHGCFADDHSLEEMARRGVTLVPTFSVIKRILGGAASTGLAEWVVRKAEQVYLARQRTVRRARELGVRIGLGSDFGYLALTPHGENAEEALRLHEAGLSPMEVVQAATRVAAEAMGLNDEFGTVERGKWADLVAFPLSPLTDLTVLQEPVMVMQHGRVVRWENEHKR